MRMRPSCCRLSRRASCAWGTNQVLWTVWYKYGTWYVMIFVFSPGYRSD